MTKFDELKERYPNLIPVQELRANVSIVELAVQYGYEPQMHKGKSRPVLEHPGYQDTIIIKNPQDAAQQVYQRAGDFADSGTIIDFIRNRLSTVFSTFNRPGENEFRNITSVLYDYLRIDPTHVKQNRRMSTGLTDPVNKQPFTKEQFDLRALEKDNYLNQRHIAPETISRPEFTGKVVGQVTYFDPKLGRTEDFPTVKEHPERTYIEFKNVAFPYYNGQSIEVTGLELRNEKVKLHAAGSDRLSSVFVSNTPPKAERFYVMESAIDALSHQQLRNIRGDDKFNTVYFSTGGQLSPEQINTMSRYISSFPKTDNWSINLAFDNDPKGHRYDLQFIQQMTAAKFPMSPTIGGLNRVAYLLPDGEAYRPIREAIVRRIDLFNQEVLAQFPRADADTLGKKEMGSQLINVSMSGSHMQISIPEASAPLSVVNKLLLNLTGMAQQVKLDKSCAKDYNQELTREVGLAEKFRYSIQDETGQVLINANSPLKASRSMQQLKHQAESEGLNKTFTLSERSPYGFLRPQATIKLENGVTTKETQTPDFSQRVHLDRQQRNQLPGEDRQPKQAINPESKPLIGELPQPGHKPPRQIKPRHE